jgi:biopolymer transport protein ExbD
MKLDYLNPPVMPLHPVLIVAGMSLFLVIFSILIFCSSFAKPAGFEIRMPLAGSSEGIQSDQTIIITAENVLYFNNKVVTLNELKKSLGRIGYKNQNIFIHVDLRSSMGRVMDVWELCRALGSSQVHIMSKEN